MIGISLEMTVLIPAGRLKAAGYGQEHPVADNSTEEGRAKNRRIDLWVTSKRGHLRAWRSMTRRVVVLTEQTMRWHRLC